MPTYIVKPDPDADLYAEWSTVVDNLVGFGTAAEMNTRTDRERMERADRYGTSALWPENGPRYLSWHEDDGFLIVTNTERRDAGSFTLDRKLLRAYVEAYRAGDVTAAEALLVPIADDDEDAP